MVERGKFGRKEFELLVVDVPHLRNLLETYKKEKTLEPRWFFTMALLGYYDAMHGGLEKDAGHVIHRLSDFIEIKERKKIDIYPSPDGSLIFPHGYNGNFFDFCESDRWDSLEDWRKLWEKTHPFIPEYFSQDSKEFALGLKELPPGEKNPQT
ncbi:MAG: hypothetical protein AAB583_05485 [Patescibacteria group bacterium]